MDSDVMPPMITLQKLMSPRQTGQSLTEAKRAAARKTERDYLINCLRETRGHITNAAKIAGVDVSDFHKAMKRHKINSKDF